jgi:hypothetical protein
MCRGRRARILLHLHTQREKIVLRGSRAVRRFVQKPSIMRVCVREEDAGVCVRGGCIFFFGWCVSRFC